MDLNLCELYLMEFEKEIVKNKAKTQTNENFVIFIKIFNY